MPSEPIKPMSKEEIEYYRQCLNKIYRQFLSTAHCNINGVIVDRLIATIDERDREIERLKELLRRAEDDGILLPQ
jgi:BioD-like phosphotransacetylase family protein